MRTKIKMIIAISIIGLLLASCTTTRKTTTSAEKDISLERLKRTEYTITADKVAEASVTLKYGLFYDNKQTKHSKGVISWKSGNIIVGNFNLNVTGVLCATAISVATGYLLDNTDFKTMKYKKHSDMIKPYSNASYLPTPIAYFGGIVIGTGLNSILAPTPYKPATSYAQYKLITDYNFDYVINPRFELTERKTFFTKTATVKITAKGINIITDK